MQDLQAVSGVLNKFYFKQDVFVLSSQTILEMGESYNLHVHRCKLYDSRGGGGGGVSYNLYDPFLALETTIYE